MNPVTFKSDEPIEIKVLIPALNRLGARGAVEVTIPFTKELLHVAQTDSNAAAFMVRQIFTAYALHLKNNGGEPV